MSARIPVVHSVAVYDGRDYLGDVAELGNGQFAAFDPDAKRLGLFEDKAEAERLVLAQRRAKAKRVSGSDRARVHGLNRKNASVLPEGAGDE